MKIWITKHALTTGIIEAEADLDNKYPKMAVVDCPGRPTRCYHGNDWHTTESAAKQRANDMVTLKLRALDKQIAKLERMKF